MWAGRWAGKLVCVTSARKMLVTSALGTAACAVAVVGVALWRPDVAVLAAGLAVLTVGRVWVKTARDVRRIAADEREVRRISIIQNPIRQHAAGENADRTGE